MLSVKLILPGINFYNILYTFPNFKIATLKFLRKSSNLKPAISKLKPSASRYFWLKKY